MQKNRRKTEVGMYTNQMLALGEEVIHVERAVQNTRGGRKRRRFLRPKHAGRDIPEEGHAKDTEGNLFESIGSRSGRSSSSSGGGGGCRGMLATNTTTTTTTTTTTNANTNANINTNTNTNTKKDKNDKNKKIKKLDNEEEEEEEEEAVQMMMMMKKTKTKTKTKMRKGLWSPEEDQKLIHHITRHGHGCWSSVPTHAGALLPSFLPFLIILGLPELIIETLL